MRDFKTMNMPDRKIDRLKEERDKPRDSWLVISVVVVGVAALIWLLSRL